MLVCRAARQMAGNASSPNTRSGDLLSIGREFGDDEAFRRLHDGRRYDDIGRISVEGGIDVPSDSDLENEPVCVIGGSAHLKFSGFAKHGNRHGDPAGLLVVWTHIERGKGDASPHFGRKKAENRRPVERQIPKGWTLRGRGYFDAPAGDFKPLDSLLEQSKKSEGFFRVTKGSDSPDDRCEVGHKLRFEIGIVGNAGQHDAIFGPVARIGDVEFADLPPGSVPRSQLTFFGCDKRRSKFCPVGSSKHRARRRGVRPGRNRLGSGLFAQFPALSGACPENTIGKNAQPRFCRIACAKDWEFLPPSTIARGYPALAGDK